MAKPESTVRFRRLRVIGLLVGGAALLGLHRLRELPRTLNAQDPMILRDPWSESRLLRHGKLGAQSKLLISEVAIDRRGWLLDEVGCRHPWVEIVNGSSESTRLDGWSLADGPSKQPWPLPRLSLGPGESLAVFCSGRNRVTSKNTLSLDLLLREKAKEHVSLLTHAGVKRHIPQVVAARASYSFHVEEAGLYSFWMRTSADGTSWARCSFGLDEQVHGEVRSGPSKEYWRIGPVEVEPGTHRLELAALDGCMAVDHVTWVRDAATGPGRLHVHANFRLREGETVVLFDPARRLQDSVTARAAPEGRTFRRSGDDEGGFGFHPPMPAGTEMVALEADDVSSVSATPLTLSPPRCALPGAVVRLATDGALPTVGDRPWTEPLQIDHPQVVRAAAFIGRQRVSAVLTRQYWVGERPDHVMFMIAVEPRLLTDEFIGIRPTSARRGSDYQRDAHHLVFDASRIYYDGMGGLRTHAGDGSDRGTRTSYKFRTDPETSLAPGFFGDERSVQPSRLILDADARAWKDVVHYEIVEGLGGIAPATRMGQMYVNGKLENAIAAIEVVDETFIAARWATRSYDLIKGKVFTVEVGSPDFLQRIAAELNRGGPLDDVSCTFDLPSLFAPHVLSTMLDASRAGEYHFDAVQGFLLFDHEVTPPRYQAIAWDLDLSCGADVRYDMLGTQQEAIAGKPWSGRFLWAKLVQRLLDEDPRARDHYVALCQTFLNHVYVGRGIRERYAEYRDFYRRNSRPTSRGRPWPLRPVAEAEHLGRIDDEFDEVVRYWESRPPFAWQHVMDRVGQSDLFEVRVEVLGSGAVRIDGQPYAGPTTYVGRYMPGSSISVALDNAAKSVVLEMDAKRVEGRRIDRVVTGNHRLTVRDSESAGAGPSH